MRILIISEAYPSKLFPNKGVFVFNLVQEFCKLGHEITVISPQKKVFFSRNCAIMGDLAKVFIPSVFTFSAKKLLFFNSYIISHLQKTHKVQCTIRKNDINFDLVYCHFIQSGLYAYSALKKYNKPFFVAVGENNMMHIVKSWYSDRYYYSFVENVKGFVAVSSIISEKLTKELNVYKNKIIVEPNCVDLNHYRPLDKVKTRTALGIPQNNFIVIFVGRSTEDKGFSTLLNAVKDLSEVKLILLGDDFNGVNDNNILIKGRVSRDDMPKYMSAADVFILPTKHEGSSNAIIEAMACGLPIISSNIPEVKLQCEESFSLLFEPNDVNGFTQAIEYLRLNEDVRSNMSRNSLVKSKKYDLKQRASRIIDFIETIIEE
jgi:glycosyltransferase involved in cell wall biosynthesis